MRAPPKRSVAPRSAAVPATTPASTSGEEASRTPSVVEKDQSAVVMSTLSAERPTSGVVAQWRKFAATPSQFATVAFFEQPLPKMMQFSTVPALSVTTPA